MNHRTRALLAAFAATAIYGINYTLAKDVMPHYIQPFGFILLRVMGATALFWLIGLGVPKEKIAPSDGWRLLGCSFFGMALNMLTFFKGLNLTTPISSSIIMTVTPILVLVLSALWIREKITARIVWGILTGLVGALMLILYGAETHQNAVDITLGNALTFINALSYSFYFIMVKPLTAKYHPVTLMKWLFLISIFLNLPFSLSEFNAVSWGSLPGDAVAKILYVVVGTTFLAYLCNIYALKYLKASTVGVFIYLQPFIAALFAVATGSDALSIVKIAAALLTFLGVYWVTRRPKTER